MLTIWKPNTLRRKENGTAFGHSVFDELDRMFDRALQDMALAPVGWSGTRAFSGLAADVSETKDEYRVRIDLPGVRSEDIEVKIENETLTVQATRATEVRSDDESFLRSERSHGAFRRSFALPASVDAAKVDARYENGVLRLTLPKREEAKPRAITVNVK